MVHRVLLFGLIFIQDIITGNESTERAKTTAKNKIKRGEQIFHNLY